jgi:bifunctional polynucleotide phosphatase/kinase
MIFKIGDPEHKVGGVIAAFDFDQTLVRPKDARPFPRDADDYEWLRADTKDILVRASKTHDIVIFTTQTKEFKIQMIKNVLAELNIDVTVAVGFGKGPGVVKKPDPELFWSVIDRETFDASKSFYVGDAAGRPNDHSDVDLKFAENVGIQFKTPEEYFPVARYMYNTTHINPGDTQEILLMIGPPTSGKTTLSNDPKFSSYTHLSGDVIKNNNKIYKLCCDSLANKSSVIIDKCNAKRADRQPFIELAKKFAVNLRYVLFDIPIELAMEMGGKRFAETGKKVPRVAFYLFRKNYEVPNPDEYDSIEMISLRK